MSRTSIRKPVRAFTERSVDVRDMSGAVVGTAALDPATFGIEPNAAVVHQVITAQLAARRRGTHSTKTRAEVSGGGKKPWRQKGTGRARQGSTRAPQWTHGGVAHGPKPQSFEQRTPKKMIRLALRSALSARAADGRIVVLDEWAFEAPKSRQAATALAALGVDAKSLVVVGSLDGTEVLSLRNLSGVHLLTPDQLNAYDVVDARWLVFTRATLEAASTDPNQSRGVRDDDFVRDDAEPEAES